MKKNVFLMVVLLFLCTIGTMAQELGANYNENIDYPITEIEMLKKSKVTWVRGFVNIPNLFLQNENGKIAGVKEDAIKSHIPTLKFVQAKKALGDRVKFILSLKIPFELYTDTVPKMGSEEMEHIFRATELLLHTYDMAKNIEILVMGNEPEWENVLVSTNSKADAEDYRAFLNEFANRLAAWKKANGWTFDIYAGALNRVSELPNSETVPAVVSVVNTNPNVDGLDLHVHALYVKQAGDDLKKIRDDYQVTKKLICTEFSMVRALNPHVADNLGTWGSNNGYSSTMKIYEYLNRIAEKASAGAPVSSEEFLSLFHGCTWYPKNWYAAFYEKFKQYDMYAITGRFSVVPGGARAVYGADTEMWELGGIYFSRYLGIDEHGSYIPNPLLYPDFITIQDALPVSGFIEGQKEIFIQWGNGVDKTSGLVIKDEEGNTTNQSLDQDVDYSLIEGLSPGKSYHISLVKHNSIVWERDIKTKTKIRDIPMLKYQQAGGYMLVQVLNLPEDAASYKIKLDEREIGMVNQDLNGQVLSVDITYDDGSIETLSTQL
ncbi:MAG: hypothetical protein LBF69_07290 [Prevotellaceae bacterium]|jgi:hypothetical protein|nr:hypothetical protein [Prevotellaceae bacterium]